MLQPLVDYLNSNANPDYDQPQEDELKENHNPNLDYDRPQENEPKETNSPVPAKATIDTGLVSYEIPVPRPPPRHVVENFLADIPNVELITETGRRKSKRAVLTAAVSQRSSKSADAAKERERTQRIHRDAFRKKVLALADAWIGCCANGAVLKRNIVIYEDSGKPKKKRNINNNTNNEDDGKPKKRKKNGKSDHTPGCGETTSDALTSKQNGYYFYHILWTKEIEELVARKRPQVEGECEMNVLIDRLATVADIYLRVMFNNNNTGSAVLIKFDDANVPSLFARRTKRTVDTCITGPPCRYWTKILHLDNVTKASQHIALQRVCFGRVMQDCTFVVVGEGGMLEQIYSVTPEHFVSPSRSRRCFKEMFYYLVSIPENDLSCLGWEVIDKAGVVDPIKTFLPKVVAADERSADDVAFVNYIDMFVTMVVHRHKMERLHVYFDAEKSQLYYDTPPQPKVHRTEYKFELAGRADHPGVYYYRNRQDYITELCMVNMNDDLYDATDKLKRMTSDDDDGVYFYDIQPVNDVLIKLKTRDVHTVYPEQNDFYAYVLSECDDVREMIAYSGHTVHVKLEDAIRDNLYEGLHETDPARSDPKRCLERLDRIVVKSNLKEYKSTYYIDKSNSLTRVIARPPADLNSRDCVLRSYRLRWKNRNADGRDVFVMYPIFSVVFKNLSLYQEIVPETIDALPDEDFSFPEVNGNNSYFPIRIAASGDADAPSSTRATPNDTTTAATAATVERHPAGGDSENPLPNFGREIGMQSTSALRSPPPVESVVATHTRSETPSLIAAGFSMPDFQLDASFYANESSVSISQFLTLNTRAKGEEEEKYTLEENLSELSSYTPSPLPPRNS